MRNGTRIVVAAIALLATATSVHAEIFYTGRADFNAAGTMVNGARRGGLESNGISYTNAFTAGAATPPAIGDTVRAVGFVTLDNAIAGAGPAGSFPGGRVIAVYAIDGEIVANPANPAFVRARFDNGQVRVYDLGAGNAPTQNNPSTWVPNLGDLTQGEIGRFTIDGVPMAYVKGGPLVPGTTTETLLVVDPSATNTATADLTGAAPNTVADFLFDYVSGSFLSNFQTFLPDGTTPVPGAQVFVRLEQTLNDTTSGLAPTSVPQLNQISQAFIGLNFANIGGGGADYLPGVFPAVNGDTISVNDGNFIVPGSTFQQVDIPEPASMLLWGAVAGLAGACRYLRRRMA